MFRDLFGQRFNRLTPITRYSTQRPIEWICRCDCGQFVAVRSQHITNGNTKSCGCLNIQRMSERRTKHGLHGTAAYKSWKAMNSRCNNPQNADYKDYGGRGIQICKSWSNFEVFLADMGERPAGKTLERQCVNEGYNKSNCVWATPLEQGSTKRNNRWIEHAGLRMTQANWARHFNVRASVIHKRLKRMSVAQALDIQ